jgi:hypothetical protein
MMSRTNGSSCSRRGGWRKNDHLWSGVLVTGYQLDCLARVHPRSREPSSSELYMRQMSGLTKGAHLEMYTGKQNLKSIESNQGYSRDTVSAWTAMTHESG